MEEESKSESVSATKILSPSDRIAELNDIDKCITQLLSSASQATAVLAGASEAQSQTLESAQESFRAASSDYFSTLSSIEVRLRRQVYALEEAGLISLGTERDTRRGRTLTANPDGGEASLSNRKSTAGGALDPSWLNARASDSVEMKMKKELLQEAKKMVEKFNVPTGSREEENDTMDEGEG